MFEHFTDRARKTMSLARQECIKRKHEFIGTEHILLGMLYEVGGVGYKALNIIGVKPEQIVAEVDKVVSLDHQPVTTPSMGQVPFSPRAKRVIELAGETASQFGQPKVGTEHILCGLLKENEGIAAQVLNNLGVKLENVKDALVKLEVINTAFATPPKKKPFDVTIKFGGGKVAFYKKATYRVDAVSKEDAALRAGVKFNEELQDGYWELVEVVEPQEADLLPAKE